MRPIRLDAMPPRASAKSSASPAAMGFDGVRPAQKPTDLAGDSSSTEALARLDSAIAELKALAVMPLLRRALDALRRGEAKVGSEWALKALNQDERYGMSWYVLAVAREQAGDFANSLAAYRAAVALLPDESEVANDLGRLAARMGQKDLAEQLFRRYLEAYPTSHEAANNLACVVRDSGRFAEAIEILRPAIKANPSEAVLWNTLGSVVLDQGDLVAARTFFDEALRHNPSFAQARYNRGNTLQFAGDLEGALSDCEAAIGLATTPSDRQMMLFARSTIKIALGRLGEGWDDYEARNGPDFAGSAHFLVRYPSWTPESPLAGRRLLLMGEQGLGDEVLFANLLPDVIEALGPDGKLLLAVEPRLVSLMQRSFPTAEVAGHATYAVDGRPVRGAAQFEDRDDIDLWTPMASLLRRFRRHLEDFPPRQGFLTPDPARVRHWRSELDKAPPGLKVGILWKSLKLDGGRARYFSPFELWAPVLKTPGVSVVNIQYGDCAPEIEWAERELGVSLWTPPGIDLKNDLDDLAALARALDLTIGFANATSNIAAATGAPTWIISTPGAWTRLGTDRMPWYPQARVFLPPAYAHWEETLASVALALAEVV